MVMTTKAKKKRAGRQQPQEIREAAKDAQAVREGAAIPGVRDFIVTGKDEPSKEDQADNLAVMESALELRNMIGLRIQPMIYDVRARRYVSLLGGQIVMKVFTIEAVDRIMHALEMAVEREQKEGQRA